jgi:predicted site-specific integrase-resolvase
MGQESSTARLELVNLSRAAQIIDCAAETLKNWADSGRLPVVRVEGVIHHERVFLKEDVIRFAAAQRTKKAGTR